MYSGKNKCSNKHMKRCLAALIIKEIRIKTTKKCYFFIMLIRLANIQRRDNCKGLPIVKGLPHTFLMGWSSGKHSAGQVGYPR